MNILGISGSIRKSSYNTLLLSAAAEMIESEGHNLEVFNISEIPIYNSDIDVEVKPQPVINLIEAISNADSLIFATPEYNYSLPGVLKNAIDWASRPAFKSALAKKPCGIVSASMSPLGGARAQVHLRDILSSTLSPVYLTPDYLLPLAQNAFNESGALIDDTAQRRLQRYVQGFIQWTSS